MMLANTPMQELLWLSHQLGDPQRGWAILGEGNTSARVDAETFLVKASGSRLSSLTEAQAARVRFAPVLEALENDAALDDAQSRDLLMAAAVGPPGAMPSVETLMHAFLLTLPGVAFVGHTHMTSVNGLLCSVRGWAFLEAGHRLFPDEIVVCGVAPCCVSYVDPGLPLARTTRARVTAYLENVNVGAGNAHRPIAFTQRVDRPQYLGTVPRPLLQQTRLVRKAVAQRTAPLRPIRRQRQSRRRRQRSPQKASSTVHSPHLALKRITRSTRKRLQCFSQNPHTRCDCLRRRILVRTMAHAAAARNEQHGRGRDSRHKQ